MYNMQYDKHLEAIEQCSQYWQEMQHFQALRYQKLDNDKSKIYHISTLIYKMSVSK